MAAQTTGGIARTRALARFHNPMTLRGLTYQDGGRVLVALLDGGRCEDGACSPRRIVVRSADQMELAGLSDHDLAEVAAVMTEHAARQLAVAA